MDDTPNQFSAAMAMDPTTPVFRPQDQWEDNEYNNYQRSYNNQEWNPAGSIARSNAHSRELGAILNTYLQVNPIEKLTLRTQFGANAHYRRSDSFVPKFNMDPLEKQDLNENHPPAIRSGLTGTGRIQPLTWTLSLKSTT